MMKTATKWTLAAALLALAALSPAQAHAGGHVSFGLAVPGFSLFVGPGYYAPPPVVYAPPPVVYAPPVYYYYRPSYPAYPVYYGGGGYWRGSHGHHGWHGRHRRW